jgi:ring-1,2-phenylacetyl-CoA epoxidase subunit PaaB
MNSLDPRVNRLQQQPVSPGPASKPPLDQFGTYEVFVQPKEGKPFQHEGAVHAPDLEMAYLLAKEAFTRRFTCISLYVADTHNVTVSPLTEGDQSVYASITDATPTGSKTFEVYHLLKRGKQHIHAGTVQAANPTEAMGVARQTLQPKMVYNVWVIPTDRIRFTQPEERDLWTTLPEKKFRDALDYRGGDKLKEYLERSKTSHA